LAGINAALANLSQAQRDAMMEKAITESVNAAE